MSAIDSLLAGLFDYAGLYPPAGLSMRSAANNYVEYGSSKHASALGRFIVNLDRMEELRSVAGDSFSRLRLSVIATENTDWNGLTAKISDGAPIDALEMKCGSISDVERAASKIPRPLTTYFEVGLDAAGRAVLKAVVAAGARAKIRMGGVVADAFPATSDVVQMLESLAELRLPFKATAGLHHPVRSRRPFTYQPQSPQGMMHGFVNLCCASALIYGGGDRREAEALLEEQDPSAWRITSDAIHWQDQSWTADQISKMRSRFLLSIGTCSFEEPIRDLESLGWL
ncbi:MAG TPA: hypothetical protein VGI45_35065 [Terracidiphilus sp.]